MFLKEKFKSILKKMAALVAAIVLLLATGVGIYYASKPLFVKVEKKLTAPVNPDIADSVSSEPVSQSSLSSSLETVISKVPPSVETKKKVKESPPEYEVSKSTVNTETETKPDGSATVKVASGEIDQCGRSIQYKTISSVSDIPVVDETGENGELGSILKDYLNVTLYRADEYKSLYSIIISNAGDTGWSGLYCGGYDISSLGEISSAYGFIIINTYSISSSEIYIDLAKVIFAHEYGHHYTLYHKWVGLDSPIGERFPDQYYSIRPLSKTGTAVDYSKGWQNCEAEIIAEDYAYFFSGYSYINPGIVSLWGYPSTQTKTFLQNIDDYSTVISSSSSSSVSSVPVPSSQSISSTGSVEAADEIPPEISIVSPIENPYTWTLSVLTLTVSASDNVEVSKVEIYVNDELAATSYQSNFSAVWRSNGVTSGTYQIRVVAYDAAGNTASTILEILRI